MAPDNGPRKGGGWMILTIISILITLPSAVLATVELIDWWKERRR